MEKFLWFFMDGGDFCRKRGFLSQMIVEIAVIGDSCAGKKPQRYAAPISARVASAGLKAYPVRSVIFRLE